MDKSEEFTVWMNNPLRYEGETFYQTGHQELGDTEISTISVVRNTGWMLPYIACMIVGFGMFAQFWASLVSLPWQVGIAPRPERLRMLLPRTLQI